MATAAQLIGFGNLTDRPEPGVLSRLWSDGDTVWRDSGVAWEVYMRSAPPPTQINNASQVGFDNTTTGLSASDVQTAIDELFALIPAEVVSVFDIRVGKTAGFTVVAADQGKNFHCTANTFTIALTAAATLGNNFSFAVFNSGSGVVTIDPDGAETIRDASGSAATKTLAQGEGGIVFCDGTAFFLLKVALSSSFSGDAVDVAYDNAVSGLTATDVQAAIDELEALIAGGSSAPVTDTSTLTGNQDNYDFGGADVLFCNNASTVIWRGLLAGVDGQELKVLAKGAGAVYFNNEDANSTAANRILTRFPITGNALVVASGGSATLVYDGTASRWVVTDWASGNPTGPQNYTELTRAADQTVPTATATFISFDTEISNNWTVFSSGNPTRLTIPTGQGGLWMFNIHFWFNSSITGIVQFGMRINGTTFKFSSDVKAEGTCQHVLTTTLVLAAADYVEFYAYQTSGSDKTIRVQAFTCFRLA